ncbi:MAG: hypothetical protein E6755_08425 [Staphylococcus epidermidis]|nr:hypothetical protein [Staphylococcus epidermidis]
MQHLIKKHVLNGEFELVRQLMSETDFMEFEEAYISKYEGALDSAYYHADSSIKLTDGNEVKSLLQMLLLHAIPEPVISDKKAFDVAKRILKLDPSNNVARNVLKDTAKRMDNVVVDINELNNQRDAR